MPETFTIAIDWDRNNNFTGTQDDVTARVQQVNWFLGMRQPWQDKADNSMLAGKLVPHWSRKPEHRDAARRQQLEQGTARERTRHRLSLVGYETTPSS